MKNVIKLLVVFVSTLFSIGSLAELKLLSDVSLSTHVGQISQSAVNSGKSFQAPLLLSETNQAGSSTPRLNTQTLQNTPSTGITLDIDLQLRIDEIRWVDVDGAGIHGSQGAVVLKGLSVGHFDGPVPQPAQIRGVTIDVDGRDGLTIGIGQIGDRYGNGIDINIDSVQIK